MLHTLSLHFLSKQPYRDAYSEWAPQNRLTMNANHRGFPSLRNGIIKYSQRTFRDWEAGEREEAAKTLIKSLGLGENSEIHWELVFDFDPYHVLILRDML
jgi:hypothetical protein